MINPKTLISKLFCSPSRNTSGISLLFKYRICSWACGKGRQSISRSIEDARDVAMARANYRCQMTGSTKDLRGHHLFDVSTYPYFAASPWNFFILTEKLHSAYHSFNGGTAKSCTIFGFWIWRYFCKQWWKGYGLASVLMVCVFFFVNQPPNL